MKSIKLKFLFETKNHQTTSEDYSQSTSLSQTELNTINLHCQFHLKDGIMIKGFVLQKEGENTFIGRPEPHPVVLYFASAQAYLEKLENSRNEVLTGNENIHKMLQDTCNYFSFATSFYTFLFNSLESFVNKMIPIGYEYKRSLRDKTELLNKEQIQRHVKFEEKIKIIIPSITGKYFHQEYGHLYEKIIKLKDCRDMIIHTKNFDYPSPYGYLFNAVFNMDDKGAINATMVYINYYERGLIEFA